MLIYRTCMCNELCGMFDIICSFELRSDMNHCRVSMISRHRSYGCSLIHYLPPSHVGSVALLLGKLQTRLSRRLWRVAGVSDSSSCISMMVSIYSHLNWVASANATSSIDDAFVWRVPSHVCLVCWSGKATLTKPPRTEACVFIYICMYIYIHRYIIWLFIINICIPSIHLISTKK